MLSSRSDDFLLLTARTLAGIHLGKTGERLEIAVGRDIEIEAAPVTVTAEENNEQPAIDSDTNAVLTVITTPTS